MELDKRIKEGKRPLTCFDIEEAKKYVGKKGYFSNYLNVYTNLCNMQEGVLHSLDEHHGEAFVEEYAKWKFFLPAEWVKEPEEWVKEPEKKYRPFSLDEFFKIFKVGDLIEFRYKDSDEVKCAMFTGYITDVDRLDDKTPGACELMLGIFHYSLLDLFKECELFLNGEWLPFGVLDE